MKVENRAGRIIEMTPEEAQEYYKRISKCGCCACCSCGCFRADYED